MKIAVVADVNVLSKYFSVRNQENKEDSLSRFTLRVVITN